MSSSADEKTFRDLINRLKSEWNAMPQGPEEFSDKSKKSLFLKLKEIEKENHSFFPWELSAMYMPRFGFASTVSALLCVVTFQLSQGDFDEVSINDGVDSEYSELFNGNDLGDEIDSNDLIVEEQQDEEL